MKALIKLNSSKTFRSGFQYSFSFIFLLVFILFISLGSVSAAGYCNPNLPGGQNCAEPTSTTYTNSTTNYINNTYVNVTATTNSTQFTSNNPITISESWLSNFINWVASTFFYPLHSNPANYYNETTIPPFLNNTNDSLGDGYTYVNSSTAYLNMTALDNRYLTQAGSRFFFFTNMTTDVVGVYNATYTAPIDRPQAIITIASGDGETLLASFITDPKNYTVLEGERILTITANASSVAKPTTLSARVYLVNLTGGNPILLRTLNTTHALDLLPMQYRLSSMGRQLIINDSVRVLFNIYSENTGLGVNPDISLYVDDDTFSGLSVPSQVGVTDISGLIRKTKQSSTIIVAASNSINKNMADIVCNSSSDDICINSAWKYIPLSGGSVHLMQGDYYVTNSILVPSNMVLEGEGFGTKIWIDASQTGGIQVITNNDSARGDRNIKITNLHISGELTQVNITFQQQGIVFENVSDSFIESNWIEHLGNIGVPSSIAILPSYTYNSIISKNIINDTTDGINTVNDNSGLLITENQILSTNRDYGINLYLTKDSTISNNIIKNSYLSNLRIYYSSNNLIANNRIESSQTEDGISSTGGGYSNNNTYVNNIIWNNSNYGLNLGNNKLNNKFINNIFKDSGLVGDIYQTNTSQGNIFVGNIMGNQNSYDININISAPNICYSNGSGCIAVSTYNSTYDLWAYNQTTPAINYCNNQITTNWTLFTSTYNSSYYVGGTNPSRFWNSSFAPSWLLNVNYTPSNCVSNNLYKWNISTALSPNANIVPNVDGSMVVWYRMDDSPSSWVTGKVSNAISLDGVNDYIDLGSPSGLSFPTNDFSIEGWIYINKTGDNQIISSRSYNAGSQLEVYLGNGTGNAQDAVSSTAHTATSTWYHVALVVNRTANNLSLYFNGAKELETPLTLTGSFANSQSVSIGRTGSVYFNGSIDEIKIYNRSLSSTEILNTYNNESAGFNEAGMSTTNLLRNYHLNETYGVIAYDDSTYGGIGTLTNSIEGVNDYFGKYNATLYNSARIIPSGVFGKATNLSASTSAITTGYNSAFDLNTSFTLSIWAKMSSVGKANNDYGSLFSRYNTDARAYGYAFFRDTSGKTMGQLFLKNGTVFQIAEPAKGINDVNWHHYALTLDEGTATNNIKIYIDGKLNVTSTFHGSINFSNTNLTIGALYLGRTDWSWNGSLDDAMIYNRALSSNEIYSIYNATSWGFQSTTDYSGSVYVQNSSGGINITDGGKISIINITCYNGTQQYNMLDLGTNLTLILEDLLPRTDATYSIGSSILRWLKGWFVDVDTKNLNVTNMSLMNNVIISGNLSVKRPYAVFTDNTTQTLISTSAGQPINFSTVEDNYLINMGTLKQNITVQQTGDYLFEVSALGICTNNNKHINIWWQKNGINVARSNTLQELNTANVEALITVPFIIDLNTTDNLRIMWGSDDLGCSLEYVTNTSFIPETPSVILTITKISEVT